MEDVILNGVSVTELVNTREKIKQEAAKFVADGLTKVESLTETILKSTDPQEIETLATEAHELLERVHVVAGVANVFFSLNWDSEYGDGPVLSNELENRRYGCFTGEQDELEDAAKNLLEEAFKSPMVRKLTNLLGSMEDTTRGWEESTC